MVRRVNDENDAGGTQKAVSESKKMNGCQNCELKKGSIHR